MATDWQYFELLEKQERLKAYADALETALIYAGAKLVVDALKRTYFPEATHD